MEPYLDVEVMPLSLKDSRLKGNAVILGGEHHVATVSEDYNFISNREAIQYVLDALYNMKIRYEILKTQFNGKQYLAGLQLSGINVTIEDQDTMSPVIVIKNSYDKTQAYALGISAQRIICSNILIAGKDTVLTQIHSYKRSKQIDVSDVQNLIETKINNFKSNEEYWTALQDQKLELEEAKELIHSIKIPDSYVNQVDNLITQIGLREELNKWRVLNAFSYILTSDKAKANGDLAVTSAGKPLELSFKKGYEYMHIVQKGLR